MEYRRESRHSHKKVFHPVLPKGNGMAWHGMVQKAKCLSCPARGFRAQAESMVVVGREERRRREKAETKREGGGSGGCI